MTATVPQTPRTLSDLGGVLAVMDSVGCVDIREEGDKDADTHCQYLEVWISELTCPPEILSELARGGFGLLSMESAQDGAHSILTVVEVGR